MKLQAVTVAAAFLLLATRGAAKAQSRPVTVDWQRGDISLTMESSEASEQGWTFAVFDDGIPWTQASAAGYTGTLFFADSWTNPVFVGSIESSGVTSNMIAFTPTREQVATTGVFVCELVIANSNATMTASRGTLRLWPTVSDEPVSILTLDMDRFGTNVFVNGTNFPAVEGTFDLPDYPEAGTGGGGPGFFVLTNGVIAFFAAGTPDAIWTTNASGGVVLR